MHVIAQESEKGCGRERKREREVRVGMQGQNEKFLSDACQKHGYTFC